LRALLGAAHQLLRDNLRGLTLDEALFAAGGYQSVLGVLKHMGGWAHVYRSYAFDAEPKHWAQTSWPRGLRDTVDISKEYVDEVIAWIDDAERAWDEDLRKVDGDDLGRPRSLHWGGTARLPAVVVMVAQHLAYHAGELNMLISISRGEAWEYTEEVEENHIDTVGHGVRGDWMTDAHARAHEEALRAAREARAGS
jgi:hypothetical protein